MLIGRLISINPEKIKNIDLLDNMQTLTIGRGSSCSIKIEDNRCSSTHCKLSLTNTGNEWKIEVEDLSTNGTFLNNQKVLPIQIGKGNKLTADWSSQLDILRAPQVDEKSKIGFKFEEIKQDKRKNEESKVEKRLVSDEKKDNDMDEKIKSTVICQICMEVMFQPVSLYPCMHNFCGGCFSDWHGRGNVECPSCRAKVNEVKKSHVIVNLVDAYFAKHPEAKRNKEELDELDAANKFKVDRVVLNKTDFKSDGSATSDSEEIAPAFRGRARARARAGSGVAAVRQQAVQNICRQCTKLVEGYKCIQGQVHLQCFGCKTYMPDRNLNQKCATCDRGYCNLYWRTGRCRVGINPVDSYKNTVFTAIRPSSISENKYEQNIINDYIRRRGLTLNIISQEMMDAMEVNKWEIDLVGRKVFLNKQSFICGDCSGLLWDFLIYKYRELIENDLDPVIKNRSKCWYGKECKTQKHNLAHAQKLNHICANLEMIYKKRKRRNSEVTFREYFPKPILKGLSKTEKHYAHGYVRNTQDLIKHLSCSILLAKNLIFKELGSEVTHHILKSGILRPLRHLPVLYVEERPEIEYERRLMSFVQFLKEYGELFSHKAYMRIIERVIDEFRPSIFIELYHPNLKNPIDEIIEFMKSEFCHINLLYGTVDMKSLIHDDFSDDKIVEKLRKFFIQILGLLTMAGANEPEVIKEIKMILNDSKVDAILKKKKCDKDKAPMGISEDSIPDLMKFIPSNAYFMDDLPMKYDLPKKPDKAEQIKNLVKQIPKNKSQELLVRRCASVDRVIPKKHREKEQDKILYALIKPVSKEQEHKTLSDNEITDDEDLETRQTSLFNYIYIPNREPEPTEYQKLGLMNPFQTLEISQVEPSILEEKPQLPTLSHPNAGDFMALVALEAMQVLPKEWVTLLQDGKLTVMCRALSQKGLIMIKGFSSMPRPPEQVLNVLLKSDLTKPDEGIFSCFTVLEVRPYFDVCHFQAKTVKGLTPREWVARRCHVKDFPCEKGFTLLLNNMDDDKILVNPEAVKGKVLSGGIVCRPIGKKATQVSLVFKAELGGLIPTRITHEMIVTTLEQFINDLRRCCDVVSEYDSELEAQKEAEEVDPEFIE